MSLEVSSSTNLQETSLKPSGREPFRAAARRQGFRWYELEGYQGRFRGHRGVGILVRHDLRSRECGRWKEHDAQALAVLVEGVFLVSLYHAGESDAHSVFSELLHFLSGAASGAPWLVAGDFNSQPHESPFCDWLLQDGAHLKAVKDAQGSLLPTRYQGDRCIDYGISSHADSVQVEGFFETRIADHYPVMFSVTPRTASKGSEDYSCLLPAPSLARPPDCDRATWYSMIEEEWAKVSFEPVPEAASQSVVDDAWSVFSLALETCLVRVLNKLQVDSGKVSPSDKPFRTGFKNTVRLIRTPVRRGSKKEPQSSFYEHRLCKLLHRLSELHRLESSNRDWCPAYQALCDQVSKWNLSGTWLQQIDVVKKLLADHRAVKDRDRIETWKQRLVNSDSECFKWVAAAGIIPPANVSSPAAPQLGVSCSTTEALEVLVAHWSAVWNRPLQWRSHLHRILQHSPSAAEQKWSGVSAEQLADAVSKLRGKAASVDGWSGTELCDLSPVVWHGVSELFGLFGRVGLSPQIWHYARQVHIPKGTPEDGVLPASKLRPITVLSTWYRLLGSCWLRSPEVRQWLQGWWPSQAVGGKKGSGVHEALISLADRAIRDEHFMISLDFSLAFGLLLQQAGLPRGFASLLQSVWCDQYRILQYDGQAYHQSVQVTTSLPQGDGWSLIAMVLCLAGPTKALRIFRISTRACL